MFTNTKALAIPDGDVVKIEVDGVVIWEAVTEFVPRLPEEYQEVEYISNTGGGSYLKLGLYFDTAATVYVSQYIKSTSGTYFFGAAENNGVLRCMLTSPSGSDGTISAYGSNGTQYLSFTNTAEIGVINKLVLHLKPGDGYIYNETTGVKSAVMTKQAVYTMTNELYLLGQNYNGSARAGGGNNTVVSFKYYDKNDTLVSDLIPCYRKADGVIGMYDTVRNIFLTNAGNGSFTMGSVVGRTDLFVNQVPLSINSDGSIYNNGLGYKVGYRVRSGGDEIESATSSITGFIKVNGGDVIRISGADFLNGSTDNAINVSDANFTNLGQIVGNNKDGYGIFLNNSNLAPYRWASVVEESYSIYKWIVPSNVGIEYIRVTGKTTNGASLIVTVNEEIQW